MSPAVGVSRPASMRSRVVFPEPEGPRKTRNSPSWVSRLTLLTAPSSPCLKTLVRFRVSTTAIAPAGSALCPIGEYVLELRLRCRRLGPPFGGDLLSSYLGEHGGREVPDQV